VNDDAPDPGVVKKEITLPDGRYLIYYTFPETTFPETADASGPNATASAPNATASAPNATASAPNATASAPNATASAPNVILSLSKDEPTP
jgi:hypothetical protein